MEREVDGGTRVAGQLAGRWEATFGPGPDSIKEARAAVEEVLVSVRLRPAVIADAVLVLTEMASNAIRHARTEFTVTVSVGDLAVRLEVFDRDTRPPAIVGLDVDSTSGRGLHIVAGLATDWGWIAADDTHGVSGKRVWAELAIEPRSGS